MARMEGPTVNGKQSGFTYIALLIGVAIIGATLAGVGQVWQTLLQREREKELLFVGNQFRRAIDSYYASNRQFPMRLDDLILDSHSADPRRHLRKIFFDPMTRSVEWGLVTLDNGQIVGIHSTSDEKPLKRTGFRMSDAYLEEKDKYSEWTFLSTVRGISNLLPNPVTAPVTQANPAQTFAK